ncbi:MAG: BspA family leucine-rich repeat surface protein [Promethearchaeota archaeon]
MIIGWCFNDEGDRLKIIDIKQWGSLRLGNSGHYFYGCKNLELTATDNLDLRGTTILHGAFWYCPNLGDSDSMNGWDVSNVTDMSNMFYNAHSFNQPIGSWDVSSVRDMSAMFRGADSFNQPIGSWDVSSVNDMELMFYMANSFNQPISDWDVWIVTNMQGMFLSADSFNQPINNWDVSRVTNMESMFSDTSFNQPLDNWNVSRVTNMAYMFSWTSSFNQPLGSWNVSRVTDMTDMFYKVKLSTSNYDNLLLGWSQLPLQPNVNFNAGNSKYSNASENAKQFIITNFSWIITDGGLATPSSEIPGYILVLIVAVLSVTIAILIKKKYDYYIKS